MTEGGPEAPLGAGPPGAEPLGTGRLGAGRLVSYALPSIGTSFLFALMLVGYLNYATEVLGVSASLVGLVFFAARVWDGISDPLVGYASDRTRARFGRRKSWLIAAAPTLFVTAVAAWSPPTGLTGAPLALWIAVAVFAFYTAFTLFEVPHMALGAELTQHRRDRVRVFGIRQFAGTLGLFGAFALGASLLEDLSTARERLSWLVLCAGIVTAVSIGWMVAALPRERPDYAARRPSGSLRAARDVWRNRDARILLFVYTAEQVATGGIGVLVPFVVRHVLRTPDLIAEMLVSYTLPALLSVPVWMALGERFDKRRLWMIAMGMSGFGFGLLCFVGEGTVGLMLAASLFAGFASGCGPTLGQALKADVIDGDDLATGERKEGAYFAAWNLVRKVAAGGMVAAVGFALDGSGFVAGAAEQTDFAKNTMVFLIGGVPIAGFAVAILLLRGFGMTQEKHARILAQLASRDAGR